MTVIFALQGIAVVVFGSVWKQWLLQLSSQQMWSFNALTRKNCFWHY